MSVEVLDRSVDSSLAVQEDAILANGSVDVLDARRRVEEKIEEMRLRRETQEFDFDL